MGVKWTDEPTTVDIVDVYRDAVVIAASNLRVTDKVFDVFGGQYGLRWVRILRDGTVSVRRDGLDYVDYFQPGDTITVVRGGKGDG